MFSIPHFPSLAIAPPQLTLPPPHVMQLPQDLPPPLPLPALLHLLEVTSLLLHRFCGLELVIFTWPLASFAAFSPRKKLTASLDLLRNDDRCQYCFCLHD